MNIIEEGRKSPDAADKDELERAVDTVFSSGPKKMVISSRRSSEALYEKIVISQPAYPGKDDVSSGAVYENTGFSQEYG